MLEKVVNTLKLTSKLNKIVSALPDATVIYVSKSDRSDTISGN